MRNLNSFGCFGTILGIIIFFGTAFLSYLIVQPSSFWGVIGTFFLWCIIAEAVRNICIKILNHLIDYD